MAVALINVGNSLADRTGDDGRTAMQKINTLITAFNAGSGTGNLPVSITLTAASTNDLNPGSGFPTNIGRLDINPTTNDVDVTGLLAGLDNQQLVIRNVGTGGFTLYLRVNSSSSAAANRFTGEGDGGIPQGSKTAAIYCTLPTPGWAIG
jgi:hypothetical protein